MQTQQTPLAKGDQLPDLTVRNHDGEPIPLRELTGQTLIIFFFPRDESRNCTVQACAIRDNWPLLRSAGVEVFGVSPNDEEDHQRFRGRYDLPFPLLVDPDMQLSQAFGFWVEKNVLGYKYMTLSRSTVIVDPDGTIRAVLRNVKARAHFDMLRVQLNLPEHSDDEPTPASDVEPEAEPVDTPEPVESRNADD